VRSGTPGSGRVKQATDVIVVHVRDDDGRDVARSDAELGERRDQHTGTRDPLVRGGRRAADAGIDEHETGGVADQPGADPQTPVAGGRPDARRVGVVRKQRL